MKKILIKDIVFCAQENEEIVIFLFLLKTKTKKQGRVFHSACVTYKKVFHKV